jgi:hypothetical protein
MIYLRAGLYAEGPTDYYFLLPLLDRMLRAHRGRPCFGDCLSRTRSDARFHRTKAWIVTSTVSRLCRRRRPPLPKH